MLKLRLKRYGRKKQPSYRLVIMESTSRRNGRSIDEVGYYNPITKESYFNQDKIIQMRDLHSEVQEYYGTEVTTSDDLKTNACCTLTPPPKHIRSALKLVADEVQAKYYGCGLTIPDAIEGLKILDLGSGSGRDCYIASQLVGENGYVVGVDMTDEQLNVAKKYIDY